MNSDSIPFDLIIDIFSRLPAKSFARFCCVSKLWGSVFNRTYFTELFLTRSSTRPRLLFAVERDKWSFFSLPQRQNPYEKLSSSLVVAADFHINFPLKNMRVYGYASSLIYFYGTWISEEENHEVPMICNPNTGRYETLPYLYRYRKLFSFFGFDPIDKLFKVLFMAYQGCLDDHKILTLETGEMRWRKIECPLNHMPFSSEGICINGVLYYLAEHESYVRSDVVDDERCDITIVFKIVCFDIRSEKFKFIDVESICKLINYKGKLGVIYWEDSNVYKMGSVNVDAIELRVWVLEDVEKQDWSKYSYTLRDDNFLAHYVSIIGATATGEIIFSMRYYTSKQPFYVFYFNHERNTLQRVEISFGDYHEVFNKSSVYTFVDHVEDLNVNDRKLLKYKMESLSSSLGDFKRSNDDAENDVDSVS